MPKPIKFFLRIIIALIIIALILIGAVLAYFTYAEYRPRDEENLNIRGAVTSIDDQSTPKVEKGKPLTIVSWNIGYGGMGENAARLSDQFDMALPESEVAVNNNLANITKQIRYAKPDLILLQEVDRNSDRSFRLDEVERVAANFTDMVYTYAPNYRVSLIPYPNPPIGQVESGLATYSKYRISEATRYQLPNQISWPLRTIGPKRCIMVNRLPVEGSEKELVVVNLQLEDRGNGGGTAQAKKAFEIMEREVEAGNYVIAGGDFDQSFSSVDISMYPTEGASRTPGVLEESAFDASWQFLMDSSMPTCRDISRPYADTDFDSFGYYMFDGFVISSNIEVQALETKDIGFRYSDHNPVLLKVVLK